MSQQERRTGYARVARRLALVALLGGTTLGFSDRGPVLAAAACPSSPPTVTSRAVRLTGVDVDFGDEAHLFGEPRGSAAICWHGGVSVGGRLYWDPAIVHPFMAGCAHIVITVLSSDNPRRLITRQTERLCSDGGFRKKAIFMSQPGSTTNVSSRVGRVEIKLSASETAEGAQVGDGGTAYNF